MTKEQAIERLKKLDYLLDDVYSTGLVEDEERKKYQDAIETVLPMLEEKDKQIDLMAEKLGTLLDLMAEKLGTLYSRNEPCDLSLKINCEKYKTCKECIKQYFENKAKERR